MSSSEFVDWMAYYMIEPWGQWRDNYHSAQIAALIYNTHSKKPLSIDDFMYKDEQETRKDADQEFLARITSLAKRSK